MFKLKPLVYLPLRRLLATSANTILEPLTERCLLRVSGPETSHFLQGLITNDIEHLSSGPGSMYSMILNNAGRVLYDIIIYRNLEKDTYYVECDCRVSDNLKKHLKMYRVRRKIDVVSLSDEYKLYVLFNLTGDLVKNLGGSFKSQHLESFRDPRLADLGFRIVAKADVNVNEQIADTINVDDKPVRNYRWLRYNLGVGEGIDDLPPGDCFPLESNCDYLHGVSFFKGCYIGQELTARVHHTGVVRKRLMPIHFTKPPTKTPDEKIVQDKVNLGKLRGVEQDVGLGLLRFEKALRFKEITFGDGVGSTRKPGWWPVEAPKEKLSVPTSQ